MGAMFGAAAATILLLGAGATSAETPEPEPVIAITPIAPTNPPADADARERSDLPPCNLADCGTPLKQVW